MKQKLLSIILVILSCTITSITSAQFPGWRWASQMGGTDFEDAYSVALDAQSNVYSTGSFQGTADFDPGAGILNLVASGYLDLYISKQDSAGNLIWAKSIGGTGATEGYSITTDHRGFIYLTGYFRGTSDFDPGPGIFTMTSIGTYDDIFVSKLDSAGNFIWARQFSGINNERGFSIAVDSSGDVYTTGYFRDSTDFDPGPGTYVLHSTGSNNIFISKLDPAGNFAWALAYGGPTGNASNCITTDGEGNVYVTGYFQGTVDFDPGPGVFSLTAIFADVFILKLSAAGNLIWVKSLSGDNGDFAHSITVDKRGNVYTTGDFTDSTDFDPGPGTFYMHAVGNSDIFISKLDAAGNFIWAKQMGGAIAESGMSMAVDDIGNIYTGGIFYGTVDFNPGPGVFYMSSPTALDDIFVTKLDSSGNFKWATRVGGADFDQLRSVALDDAGNLYIAGTFASDSINLGPYTLMQINVHTTDLVIAKVDNGLITGMDQPNAFASQALIFPNPTTDFVTIHNDVRRSINNIRIFDALGRNVYDEDIQTSQANRDLIVNVSKFPEGFYFVSVSGENYAAQGRFVVAK